MNRITRRLTLFTSGVLLACSVAYSWAAPEYRGITILHTNDTHAHLLPFSYPDPRDDNDRSMMPPVFKNIGGIARRTTLARQIRSEMRGDVLLLDAGDLLDGTPFSIEFDGKADIAAMSAAGYDLRINGNHDFNLTMRQFERNVRMASFPTICANLIDRKTGKPALPQYKIFDIEGAKIAIFGLTLPSPSYKAAKEGLDFTDPIEAAREVVPALRKQADIVIALTHIGLESDKQLAKEVPGIDIIVGGHSHSRLTEPIFIKNSEPGPFSVSGTLIVHDGQWGGELGRLDLRLRRDGGPFTLMSYDGQLIPVTSSIPEDSETAKVVAGYYRSISTYYDQEIGEATADFIDDPFRENAVLNLVCDVIRESTGAQVSIYNTGGVRSDIIKGKIRMWDIATALPFQSRMVMLEMTGERLKKALETLKPGVSGIRYRIEDDKLVEATIDGKPIDDQTIYKVATIDFMADFGFKDITARKNLDTNCRDAVTNYIRTRKKITPVIDGRRVNHGSPAPV